jgi:hypothetical protein
MRPEEAGREEVEVAMAERKKDEGRKRKGLSSFSFS